MNLQLCTKSSSHWLRTRNPETEMRLDIARTTIYGRVCRLISEEKRKKGGGRKKNRGIVDNKSAEKRARSNGGEQETEEGGAGLGGPGLRRSIVPTSRPSITEVFFETRLSLSHVQLFRFV